MGRPKEFDADEALDAAVSRFRDTGFAGTSAAVLVDAMNIGRQSLYSSFGDKRQLYLAAVKRYGQIETAAHLKALRGREPAIEGIRAVLDRVIEEARNPCLGVNSICELGTSDPSLNELRASLDQSLRSAFVEHIKEAQAQGDIAPDLVPDEVVDFLHATFAGIRVAARGGAPDERIRALGQMAMRAIG